MKWRWPMPKLARMSKAAPPKASTRPTMNCLVILSRKNIQATRVTKMGAMLAMSVALVTDVNQTEKCQVAMSKAKNTPAKIRPTICTGLRRAGTGLPRRRPALLSARIQPR